MADYATLKAAIAAAIKQNGNKEITGNLLQQSLLSMIDALGAGYQFIGIAVPATNPGTPDQNVFYLAGSGEYPNFSNAIVADGYIGVFKYNGSWTIETVKAGKDYDQQINQLEKGLNKCVEQGISTIGDDNFYITDKNGNVVLGVENGNIVSKKFNSSQYRNFLDFASGDDFCVCDKNGNVVLVVTIDGTIKTKKFDSEKADIVGTSSNNTFYITDKNGNVVLEVSESGHIKTKMFDSSQVNNKKRNTFSILGDSWSAIKDFVQPSNNAYWYPTSDPGAQGYGETNDVETFRDMWWYKFAINYSIRLISNNALSGSRIANSGSIETSFLSRENDLGDIPELIIVLGTRNDDNNTALGEYKYSDWTQNDLTYYRPACAKLLNDLQAIYIGSTILFVCNSANADKMESAEQICEHYNVPFLQLTLSSSQLGGGHPNKSGMDLISENIIEKLNTL